VALPLDARAAAGLNIIPALEILVPSLIVFALLIYPVNRWLIAPLVRILEARDARISGAADSAERLTRAAAQERDRLAARMAEARAVAQTRRGEILAQAKREEQRILDAARADASREVSAVREAIEGELDTAREALSGEANSLALEAAARILGRSL